MIVIDVLNGGSGTGASISGATDDAADNATAALNDS
jgi:hypothetical protein